MSIVLFDAHEGGDDIILGMDIKGNNQLLLFSTVCLLNILASNPYIKQIPKITNPINRGCVGNVIALLIILRLQGIDYSILTSFICVNYTKSNNI